MSAEEAKISHQGRKSLCERRNRITAERVGQRNKEKVSNVAFFG